MGLLTPFEPFVQLRQPASRCPTAPQSPLQLLQGWEAMEKYLSESLVSGLVVILSRRGIIFVKKKDGTLRPLLPLLDEVFLSIGRASSPNWTLGMLTIIVLIRQGDERKTTFNTPLGHFEYLVMPF